ncbi:MAG TPA: hypothetical protein VFC39_01200 [Acidobacteriaceae bacterium]|nr:hypothetical protein [Acidobacteriaceae bacterium]
MRLSSIEQLKSSLSPQGRFAPAQEGSHRARHGGTAWAPASLGEVKLYQPQDGAVDPRSRVADIASRMRKMAGEPEDARLTGGTRSLMRRLSGLNVGLDTVRRAKPALSQAVAQNIQLTNANVA